MKKRLTAIILITTLILGCFTVVSFGASPKKKMTVYDEVLKKGNTVFCVATDGIYKVDLKTKNVNCLVKEPDFDIIGSPKSMKFYKGYLYFTRGGAVQDRLYRIKPNGKGKKSLASIYYDYAISKNKIYYESYNFDKEKTTRRQMKLNGKSKKSSKYSVRNKCKKTNAKGYSIYHQNNGTVTEYDEGEPYYVSKHTDYLKTPGGLIQLCTYTTEE